MSRLLLFTAITLTAFTSCSVYRSGETTNTPDDVYYSPARGGGAAAYVETDRQRDGYRNNSSNNNYYDNSYGYDDYWLRMRVRDRYRWSAFDDYDWNDWRYNPYNYNNFGYGSNLGVGFGYNPFYYNNFNRYFNNYYSWNSWYNPYSPGIIIVNPKGNTPVYNKVREFNMSRYTNNAYSNSNRPLSLTSKTNYLRSNNYNNGNTRTTNQSLGNSIRKVFSNGESNSGSGRQRNTYYTPGSNDRPVRTYTPSESSNSTRSYTPSSSGSSSSGSSGGSSGGAGGGGGGRPARGGR